MNKDKQQEGGGKPPIRSVEEYHASFAEWEAAQICSDQHPDASERKRATEAQIVEEGRWDECNHLFDFDDEGNIVRLTPTPSGASSCIRPSSLGEGRDE